MNTAHRVLIGSGVKGPSGYVRTLRSTVGTQTGSTFTATVNTNESNGDSTVVIVKSSGNIAVNSVTDSKSNTYTKIVEANASYGPVISIWWCKTPTILANGDTVTATMAASVSGTGALQVYDYTGLVSVDVTGTNGSSASVTSGSVATSSTTTQAGDIALVAVGSGSSPPSYTVTGYTARDLSAPSCQTYDKTLGSAGTETASITLGASANYAAAIVTFKTS